MHSVTLFLARCSRALPIPLRLSLLPRAAESEFLGRRSALSPWTGLAAEPLGFLRFLSAVGTFTERLGGELEKGTKKSNCLGGTNLPALHLPRGKKKKGGFGKLRRAGPCGQQGFGDATLGVRRRAEGVA